MPIIARHATNTNLAGLMDTLRRELPKEFFTTVKSLIRQAKSGKIALGFEPIIANDVVQEAPAIADYIQNLYEYDKPLLNKWWSEDKMPADKHRYRQKE